MNMRCRILSSPKPKSYVNCMNVQNLQKQMRLSIREPIALVTTQADDSSNWSHHNLIGCRNSQFIDQKWRWIGSSESQARGYVLLTEPTDRR